MRKSSLVSLFMGLMVLPVCSNAMVNEDQDAAVEAKTEQIVKKALSNLPKLSGYAQIGYMYNDAGKTTSTFKVNRVRFILTGDISKTFDYKMQMEGFANSTDAKSKSLLSIQDMFVRAKIAPELHVQVGQFPISLSMENFDISPATLETVTFSSIVNKMVCRNAVTGFSDYGRDQGIMASGGFVHKEGFDVINYNLAMMNGSLMNQNDRDNSKEMVARLTIRPTSKFRVSASTMYGKYDYKVGEEKANADFTRVVAGGWYQGDQLVVRGEYGSAKSNDADVHEESYYGLVGYKFCNKVMPLVRYDVFENKKVSQSKETNWVAGVLYSPLPKLKVQIDYTNTKYALSGKSNTNKFECMIIGLF